MTEEPEDSWPSQKIGTLPWFFKEADHRLKGGDAVNHFQVLPEFKGASYQKRYEILCRSLMLENFYTSESVITTPRESVTDGSYAELSQITGLRTFLTTLAGHVATESAQFPASPTLFDA